MNQWNFSDKLFYSILAGMLGLAIISVGIIYAVKTPKTADIQPTNEIVEPIEEENSDILEDEQEELQEELQEQELLNSIQPYVNIQLNFNPRKCLFNVGGICFGHPFFAKGMSYMECKQYKEQTGVDACEYSDDILSSAAYVCGGINNLPTPDELVVLANDMYGSKFDNYMNYECDKSYNNKICNTQKANRINSKPYIEYFREIARGTYFESVNDERERENMKFTIISNQHISDSSGELYGRFYEADETSLRKVLRSFHTQAPSRQYTHTEFSICVDRSQSKPLNVKYPIQFKPLTYNEDAENELF